MLLSVSDERSTLLCLIIYLILFCSDKVWPASASRSADLQSLVDDFEKYKNLDGPVPLIKFGREIKGNENLEKDEKHCK